MINENFALLRGDKMKIVSNGVLFSVSYRDPIVEFKTNFIDLQQQFLIFGGSMMDIEFISHRYNFFRRTSAQEQTVVGYIVKTLLQIVYDIHALIGCILKSFHYLQEIRRLRSFGICKFVYYVLGEEKIVRGRKFHKLGLIKRTTRAGSFRAAKSTYFC